MVKSFTSLDSLSPEVKDLITKRDLARKQGNYQESDSLRDSLESRGYIVNDTNQGTQLLKKGDSDKLPATSYLVLFGSGEIAPSSVSIYRDLFLSLKKKDLHLVLISTPAGFQPNVETVYGDIRDFLLNSLPDFNLTINIVYANNKDLANDTMLLEPITTADIIMLGPGSPTYAVRHLRDTLALSQIKTQVKNSSSTLILASAATLAFSSFCLPVYEIYKVGTDLYWEMGLDFYPTTYKSLSIIPHFNNNEGGDKLDTSYCYIGKKRCNSLLSQLPSNQAIWGIDEHTAVIIDSQGQVTTRGKGRLHKLSY